MYTKEGRITSLNKSIPGPVTIMVIVHASMQPHYNKIIIHVRHST